MSQDSFGRRATGSSPPGRVAPGANFDYQHWKALLKTANRSGRRPATGTTRLGPGYATWIHRRCAGPGLSPSTIGRIWRQFDLKPHLQDGFKLSTDPLFVEKIVDG
jgi:hypothetical protein